MNTANLIDMNGNVVHTWPLRSVMREPLRNGHFITFLNERKQLTEWEWDAITPPEDEKRILIELDWDGNTVWKYNHKDRLRHDFYVMTNDNILAISRETVPEKYKERITNKERKNRTIYSDYLIEVTRESKVVWEWHEYEHLDITRYCPHCGLGDWTHTNTVQELPETDLGMQNTRFRAGNILINPRNHDTIYIIDKETNEVV